MHKSFVQFAQLYKNNIHRLGAVSFVLHAINKSLIKLIVKLKNISHWELVSFGIAIFNAIMYYVKFSEELSLLELHVPQIEWN